MNAKLSQSAIVYCKSGTVSAAIVTEVHDNGTVNATRFTGDGGFAATFSVPHHSAAGSESLFCWSDADEDVKSIQEGFTEAKSDSVESQEAVVVDAAEASTADAKLESPEVATSPAVELQPQSPNEALAVSPEIQTDTSVETEVSATEVPAEVPAEVQQTEQPPVSDQF